MTLDFAFSESIGSLISDGKHPPIHALACPLQVEMHLQTQRKPAGDQALEQLIKSFKAIEKRGVLVLGMQVFGLAGFTD